MYSKCCGTYSALSPAPSTLTATKTPKNTEEDSNDTEYSSDQLYSQSKGAATENYL